MHKNKILDLIGRSEELFVEDINKYDTQLKKIVSASSFVVIGGAGSIGQSVAKEIFKRNPKKLHIVDINENNLTELVRDIRSSFGYINGEFNWVWFANTNRLATARFYCQKIRKIARLSCLLQLRLPLYLFHFNVYMARRFCLGFKKRSYYKLS